MEMLILYLSASIRLILKEEKKMKRKILSLILVSAMGISIVACGKSDNVTEEIINPTTGIEVTNPATNNSSEHVSKTGNGKTVGQTLFDAFKNKAADNNATSKDIAEELLKNDVINFAGASMPVEEGLLTGFENVQIHGFKEGVMFSPMIGAIPFVGYIFTLDDSADKDAFVKLLKDNANPGWNICTQADETIVETVGNKVFFLMSPKSFDDGQ